MYRQPPRFTMEVGSLEQEPGDGAPREPDPILDGGGHHHGVGGSRGSADHRARQHGGQRTPSPGLEATASYIASRDTSPVKSRASSPVKSRASGVVIGRRVNPIVYQGEALVHIAEIESG